MGAVQTALDKLDESTVLRLKVIGRFTEGMQHLESIGGDTELAVLETKALIHVALDHLQNCRPLIAMEVLYDLVGDTSPPAPPDCYEGITP